MRQRVNTSPTGWRLPRELIAEVHAQAKRRGIREGRLVSRALSYYFGQQLDTEHVYSAAELEQRVKFPPALFHGK